MEDLETESLVLRELGRGGHTIKSRRVEDADQMHAALTADAWDLIVSGWKLSRFGALEALEILEDTGRDLPFIVVSDSIDEHDVVTAMRAGAHDYVVKERMTRLGDVIERELRDREIRASCSQADNALHARQEFYYRRLIETTSQGVWIVDADGETTFVNAAMAQMLGVAEANVAGQSIHEFVLDDECEALSRMIETRCTGSRGQSELRLRRADGSTLWTLIESSPLVDERGDFEGVLFMVMDVTERKRTEREREDTERRELEEQLQQAQKMEAIGHLAGGIAHDFNNVLTVIWSCANLLSESLAADDSRRDDADEIATAAAQGATISRQLLTMSRHGPAEPRAIRICKVVDQFRPMIGRLVGDQVTVAFHQAETPAVVADPVQVEQVLMNLAVNARDAMPSGGRLTIETRAVSLNDEAARARGIPPGPYVELAVTDTGTGMDCETQKRIFEPFFTTKLVGKGTGLGLAIVHGIVTQAGGTISVYSEPGHGTSFRILWPVATADVDSDEPDVIAVAAEIPAATILIVDDQDDVRRIAARILRGAGCTVLEAGSGEEARRITVSHDGPIDLALCDVILPDVRGEQLVSQLRGLRPSIRSVLMSGYPAGALSTLAEPALDLLNKPFTPASLRAAIAYGLNGWQPPTTVADETTQVATGDRVRVLLADDDEPLRKVLARSLRRSNCAVVEVGSGRAAVAELQSQQFDVIFSDVNMPDGTGLDLMRSVRRVDLDVPIVLMSGEPEISSATTAIEYGAFRFLVKPINLDELVKITLHAARVHDLARLRRKALSIGSPPPGAIDRAGLEVRFELALDRLWMAFQPIVDARSGALFGVEALVRSDEPSLASPQTLLDTATQIGGLPLLGRKIRALSAAAVTSRSEALFVNLHPEDLLDADLITRTSPLARIADRVILEITERAALVPSSLLADRIARLRELGFRLAVDDLGAGYSGLASFTELVPEVVKIDMSLVRGVHISTLKQRTIAAMCRLCRESGTLVVCEGVETIDERDCVVSLGCDLLQGYVIGKPARELPAA